MLIVAVTGPMEKALGALPTVSVHAVKPNTLAPPPAPPVMSPHSQSQQLNAVAAAAGAKRPEHGAAAPTAELDINDGKYWIVMIALWEILLYLMIIMIH
jgi:hypothetical protein